MSCIFTSGNTKTNAGKPEIKHKPFLEQATDLTSVFDRITALRRSASAAQIFIARHIVINTLSFLAVRYIYITSLSQYDVFINVLSSLFRKSVIIVSFFSKTSCDLCASLSAMGLSDVRKAVALMGLTAAGRVELQESCDASTSSDPNSADLEPVENWYSLSHASTPSFLQLVASSGYDSVIEGNLSALPHLRSAIAALGRADKTASSLVLHMCTKVMDSLSLFFFVLALFFHSY